MNDLTVIKLFSKNDSERKMELKEAKALYNTNYIRYYDEAIAAHQRGIDYW